MGPRCIKDIIRSSTEGCDVLKGLEIGKTQRPEETFKRERDRAAAGEGKGLSPRSRGEELHSVVIKIQSEINRRGAEAEERIYMDFELKSN